MNVSAAEHLRKVNKGVFRTSEGAEGATQSGLRATVVETNIPPHIMNWLNNNGSGAMYSQVCAPHSQLGVDAYVHITSPIRRLVDILNQILFQSNVSEYCQTFLDKWTRNLDEVNRATKDIRKTQMDCELLALVNKNGCPQEFSGILFDRTPVSCKYEYTVYIEELKMFSRIKLEDCIENFTKSHFCIFVFEDEDRLCRKIRLQLVR